MLGIALIGLLGACILRLLPAWRGLIVPGRDAQFHQYYTNLIRSNGHRLPKKDRRIIGPGENTYPALFHWLLSYLSPASVRWVEQYCGFVLDLAVAIAIAASCSRIAGLDPWITVSIVALQLISPPLTFSFIGPRAFTLSPRIFSQNAYMLSVLLLMLSSSDNTEKITLTILSAMLLAISLLSSKFALQHVLFTVPIVALAGWWQPLLAALLAIALAQLVSRGFFWRQLRGQLDYTVWYWRLNRHFVEYRGDWAVLWKAFRSLDWIELGKQTVVFNPILVGLVRHTILFVALWLAFTTVLSEIQQRALWLTLAALVPWFITSFSYFRVLGEAERYLEYAWPAYWLLFWTIVPPAGHMIAVISISILFLGFYAANLMIMNLQWNIHSPADRDRMLELVRAEGDTKLFLMDTTDANFFLAGTQARIIHSHLNHSMRGDGEGYFEWFYSRYPFVSARRWPEIEKRYRPDLVLLRSRAAKAARAEMAGGYNLTHFDLVEKSGEYSLFRRAQTHGQRVR